MNGFEIVDRYDIVLYLLMGVLMSGILALGGPLWAIVLVMFVGSVVGFVRHFDEIMRPDELPETDPEPPTALPRSRQVR